MHRLDDPATEDTGSGSDDVTYLDIGAYEFQPTCEGDVDGNGLVEFADLLAVLAAWGACD